MKEIIKKLIKKINGAYHDRDDYPPYTTDPFSDRAKYHAYIIKILEEELDE